jgi:hypothetical protein
LITRRCGDGDALAVQRNDRHHRPAGCALLDGLDGAFASAVGGADRILRPRSAPVGVCIVGKLNAYSGIAELLSGLVDVRSRVILAVPAAH